MMIRVMYPDGSYDFVRNDMLDILVANRRIKRFLRATGWVDIERDRVRARLGHDYSGFERRAAWPDLALRS